MVCGDKPIRDASTLASSGSSLARMPVSAAMIMRALSDARSRLDCPAGGSCVIASTCSSDVLWIWIIGLIGVLMLLLDAYNYKLQSIILQLLVVNIFEFLLLNTKMIFLKEKQD